MAQIKFAKAAPKAIYVLVSEFHYKGQYFDVVDAWLTRKSLDEAVTNARKNKDERIKQILIYEPKEIQCP